MDIGRWQLVYMFLQTIPLIWCLGDSGSYFTPLWPNIYVTIMCIMLALMNSRPAPQSESLPRRTCAPESSIHMVTLDGGQQPEVLSDLDLLPAGWLVAASTNI